jgi:hypothetical protein
MFYPKAVTLDLLEVHGSLRETLTGSGFALAGGTSLALRLGHRISTDLDFFSIDPFEPETLASLLGVGPEAILGQASGTLRLRMRGVKAEFLRHNYPRLCQNESIEGIEMWSLPDVAAMKLNAISNRGSKKDFYDVAALLSRFSLRSMLDFYQTKYQPASMMMVVRSLSWFDDADAEPDPISLRKTSWNGVIDTISAAIRDLR